MLQGKVTKLVKEFVETDRSAVLKSNEISFSDIVGIIQSENFKVNNVPFKRFIEVKSDNPITEITYQ